MNRYDELEKDLLELTERMATLKPGTTEYKVTLWAINTHADLIARHPDRAAREAERRQARQLAAELEARAKR